MSVSCEKDLQITISGLPRCLHLEDTLSIMRPAVKDYNPLTTIKTCVRCAASAEPAWDGIFRGASVFNQYCLWSAALDPDVSQDPLYSVRGQAMRYINLISTGPWSVTAVCNDSNAFQFQEIWSGSTALAANDKTPESNPDNPKAVGVPYTLGPVSGPDVDCYPVGTLATWEIVAVVPPP